MLDLEWRELAEGYGCGDYLITPAPGRPSTPWQLQVSDRAARRQGRRAFLSSFHATLNGAKDRAHRIERERLIKVRAVGHAVVAVSASVAFAVLVPQIDSILEFVLAIGALYLALRSFSYAVSVKLGDVWGWTRDRGEPARFTWSDRAVLFVMEHLRLRTINAIDVDPDEGVRVLPPDPTR